MSASTERPLAVVTGASQGIGRASAIALGKAGYRVVLVARGKDAIAKVASELQAAGGLAVEEPLDAGDAAAVLAMAARVRAAHGAPHAIVNAAGAGSWKFLDETTMDEAHAMVGAPFLAALHVTHAFLSDMLAKRAGVIIHVGSPASAMALPGATVYTAVRWALRGLHEALRQDLAGSGVRSCHVVFGKVSSSYFANNPGSEERIPTIASMIRTCTPEECAEVIVRTIRRPRAQVVYPFMARFFYALNAVVPWLVRYLARSTGRKRSAY